MTFHTSYNLALLNEQIPRCGRKEFLFEVHANGMPINGDLPKMVTSRQRWTHCSCLSVLLIRWRWWLLWRWQRLSQQPPRDEGLHKATYGNRVPVPLRLIICLEMVLRYIRVQVLRRA